MRRLPLLVASFSFLVVGGGLPVGIARAEDAPDAPAPKAKKEFDDASIFQDWKLCKQRGASHCKTRGEFWAGKSVGGKDLLWLGSIWARGEDHAKAIDALNQFLEWKPDASDTAGQGTNQKNRPVAWTLLIQETFESKQYDKTLAAAEKFREEFPDSVANVLGEYGYDIPGHAARLSGDEPKAIELFTKSAEQKYVAGLLDLVDVHLAAGRLEEAKAALPKYSEGYEKGLKEIEWMKGLLDAVGSPAPSLAETKNIGTTEAPTAWDRTTILFRWGMQTGMADRSLRNLEVMRRAHSDTLNLIGVASYKQYNPITMKVEAEMTEDQEIELYKKMIAETFVTPQPPSIVVRQDWLDAAKIKWDRQFLIVDKEGKIRYARLSQEKPWDLLAVEQAAKQFAAK
jgi:tetratricopeptide (TPR) repeat protein